MVAFSAITDSVISLFIIILVGFYGGRKKIITSELNNGLTDILIQIALPFMIISSFVFTYDDTIKDNVLKTFYYSFAAYLIIALISYLLLIPIKHDKKTILHFGNVFVNTGYVGFPILYSIYGSEGVIYGSIFNMFFVIFLWTYGIMLYSGKFDKKDLKNEMKKVLFNPSIIAVIIGLSIMIFDLTINNAILSGVRNIGNISGPLSMLIIGVILSNVKIKNHLKDWTIYYGIVVKLIIIPIIIYFISISFIETSKAINSVIIMTGMPAAAMTSIFAESYNKEKEYAAIIVSSTTLISLITVPILLKFLI
ncbi:MAG: permease [Bacillota bacterium]|jgi:predicted permease|nr:permease [Bacillota bacterium]